MTVQHPPVASPFSTRCQQLGKRYIKGRRILLVQIPQFLLGSFNREVAHNKGYYCFPPTGLQYIHEAVSDLGWDVGIYDLNFQILKRSMDDPAFYTADWLNLFVEHYHKTNPDIVGVSCMFDAGINPLIKVLQFLAAEDRSLVVTGGVIATYEYKNLLNRSLSHMVVCGEGESRFRCLLETILGEQTGETSGIYYMSDKGVEESAGVAEPLQVRGNLISSYAGIAIETYHNYGSLNPFSRIAELKRSPFAAIQLNRGCRAACSFCAVRDFMGRGVRARGVQDLLEEMEYLIGQRGIRHFEWLDDDLLAYREEFKDFLRETLRRGWKFTWSANNGLIAASLDEETLELMDQTGCIGFKIGVETGNAHMLKVVKKPGTLQKFLNASELIQKFPRIFVGANFIIGLPNETFGQMLDSLQFNRRLNLDWAAYTICQVIRGASAFSDFADYFDRQIEQDGKNVKNFIPTRESVDGHLLSSGVRCGFDVFSLDRDTVPSAEQTKEIWFTFNLLSNYILNKNLGPGSGLSKFIAWVEMAHLAYPDNAYMSLFLALAYRIKGDADGEVEHFRTRMTRSAASEYWSKRFAMFGLDGFLAEFPSDVRAAQSRLAELRAQALQATMGVMEPVA